MSRLQAPAAPGTTTTTSDTTTRALATIRATVGAADAGVYLGAGSVGPAWAGTEQAVLVLGPPRSGKTSSIVVPTVLGAPGAVVSTSTKPDVLRATAHGARHGRTVPALRPERHRRRPAGRASACGGRRWRAVARGTTRCSWPGASWARPDPGRRARRRRAGGRRPLDRAGRSAAGPHAARRRARRGGPRHRAVVGRPAQRRHRARDPRPQRRHPPRRPPGRDRRHRPPGAERHLVDGVGRPRRLPQRGRPGHAPWRRTSTPGPSATRRPRSISVPRAGTRPWPRPWWWACSPTSAAPPTPGRPPRRGRAAPADRPAPVVLALDEVANIAPIPDLPGMVSEGGGQGLLTLACLQDLSQARGRWGAAADGFLSLFGTTVVLPGIGDVRTLEALSALAGEEEVRTRSVSAPVPSARGCGRGAVPGGARAPGPARRAGADGDDVDGHAAPAPRGRRGAGRDGDGARGRRAQPHGMGAAHARGSPPSRGGPPRSGPGAARARPRAAATVAPAPGTRARRTGRGRGPRRSLTGRAPGRMGRLVEYRTYVR